MALYAAVRVGRFGRPSATLARDVFPFGLRGSAGYVAGLLWLENRPSHHGFDHDRSSARRIRGRRQRRRSRRLPTRRCRGSNRPLGRARHLRGENHHTLRVFRLLLLLTIGVVAVGFACSPLIPIVFGSAYGPSIEPFLILLPGAIGFMPCSFSPTHSSRPRPLDDRLSDQSRRSSSASPSISSSSHLLEPRVRRSRRHGIDCRCHSLDRRLHSRSLASSLRMLLPFAATSLTSGLGRRLRGRGPCTSSNTGVLL